RARILQQDVGALGLLNRMVVNEGGQAVLAGEDEVAVLAKAYVGVGAEMPLQLADEAEGEARQPDVLGDRELLPELGAGARGRGPREGGIALDQRDRAGKAFLAQEPGERRADNGPADDRNVECPHQCAPELARTEPASFAPRKRPARPAEKWRRRREHSTRAARHLGMPRPGSRSVEIAPLRHHLLG